jgi:DNA-binding transcriptional LysR family regulator
LNPSLPSRSAEIIEGAHVNLDVALLRTFVAVVELGSVARAAERVGRSQPAASLQMKRLEDVIGTPLFRKSGRGLSLTEDGDVLLTYAHRLLELNDETVAAATTLKLSGSVRLGIPQDFAEGVLTNVLARFARTHPSVAIEVRADKNAVLREALTRRQLDFMLTFGDGTSRDVVKLGSVPIVWIASRDRSWERAGKIPLIVFDLPCEFRRVGVKALEAAGMAYRIAFSSPSLSSQWSAIEAGLGISVRTPIGLRSTLRTLGRKDGLPELPDIDVCLRSGAGKQDAPAQKLQEIVVETIRENLRNSSKQQRLRAVY